MGLQGKGALASGAVICGDCGAEATGNFCSACGADLRNGSGVFGAVASNVNTSYPATYLRILLSPVKETVALADDPAYRQHISFLLTSLALFCLIMVPFFIQSADPSGGATHYSESMQTMLKVLSQAGIYVGAIITFLLAFGIFRVSAREKRSLRSYLKLYCLAFGFVMPPYAIYDYVARGMLGSTGLSSFAAANPTLEQIMTPGFAATLATSLLLWAYFIAIHRRFWRMSLPKAGILYSIAAIASYKIGFWLMYFVGYWTAFVLIRAGIVSVT
jgi:hypothetical protein